MPGSGRPITPGISRRSGRPQRSRPQETHVCQTSNQALSFGLGSAVFDASGAEADGFACPTDEGAVLEHQADAARPVREPDSPVARPGQRRSFRLEASHGRDRTRLRSSEINTQRPVEKLNSILVQSVRDRLSNRFASRTRRKRNQADRHKGWRQLIAGCVSQEFVEGCGDACSAGAPFPIHCDHRVHRPAECAPTSHDPPTSGSPAAAASRRRSQEVRM